ncbi:MAG: amino acid racemase [Novosphingobium sp.]|nr:amino acid racemase [Novosphingobium sp.]
MRKLGLIGGMSWVSTRTYYEHINRTVQARAGALSSAPLLIESLDFAQLAGLSSAQDWDRAAGILSESAQRLEQAGAGALVIGANSMHKVYDRVAAAVSVPILHIADCVGARMKADGVKTAALIGTRNVMTESFYRERLVAHGVDLLPPDMGNVEALDRIIYEELMRGKVTRSAQRTLKTIITVKEQERAQAIVLACTELEMVVDVDANVLPIYDCTQIHARSAAEWILGED